jgi:hypothetical protein
MATPLEMHAYGVARALGIQVESNAVDAVVGYCEAQVAKFAAAFACATLDDLRLATANGLRTLPVTVTSDSELATLKATYTARRELWFATIEEDLSPSVYGQTIRLLHKQVGERPFVSVIDARSDKAARACFTEWHEYAHLLTLTDPLRTKFQRSHGSVRPPEEALMDAIAARIGFFEPLFVPNVPKTLTFASISALRSATCPTASWTSLLSAIARVWPKAAITIRADMQVKAALQVPAGQGSFGFFSPPPGELRAVQAIGNEPARLEDFRIHRNMRVPASSVIHRAFVGSAVEEGQEDLEQWETSNDGPLAAWPVYVIARVSAGGVDALVIDDRQ